MKKTLVLLISVLIAAFFSSALTAETVQELHDDAGYMLTAYYNASVQPGDALFVRLELTPKKTGLLRASSTASISLLPADGASAKPIRTADCYLLNRGELRATKDKLLSGVPLSSFLETGSYTLLVRYKPFAQEEETLALPVTVVAKEFVSETIPLDSRNTAIKTNVSKERQDQINRLNAILGARNEKHVYTTTAFVAPTPATRRTSFFADRRIFTYTGGGSSTTLHYGIDYGVPTGSEVRACSCGKVVMAEDRISTGWSVCIEHLPGLYSLYYHMSRLNVEVGDFVSTGDLLGLSGATGLATGPHLHWEVRLNMEAVSPDFFTSDFAFEQAASTSE